MMGFYTLWLSYTGPIALDRSIYHECFIGLPAQVVHCTRLPYIKPVRQAANRKYQSILYFVTLGP